MNSLSNEEFQRNNITLNKWLFIEYYVCEITSRIIPATN